MLIYKYWNIGYSIKTAIMIIYLLLMKIILKDHKFLESANDDG